MADVEGLFLRGKEAADRGNYDYAIALFHDVLTASPDHRNARVALRGCEMEMFRNRGGGAKAKIGAFLKGLGSLIAICLPGKDPDKTMAHCEKYLVHDPGNIFVLRKLAAACLKRGHLNAAADTLEFARQRSPKCLGVLRELGEVNYAQGNYDKAVRCYQEVVAVRPDDRLATQRAKEISAEAHLKRSHMERAESFRESLRDVETTEKLLHEDQMFRSKDQTAAEIAKAQKDAEANPNDADAFGRLGHVLYKYERYAEAEKAYMKAFQIGKRYAMRERMGDARIRQHDQAVRRTQAAVEESGRAPDTLAKLRDAKEKRLEFCVKEYAFRRQQHPTDMKLAWQLGLYCFELGGEKNIQKAIQQFQQAMSNTSLKLRAQQMLGRCFAKDPKTLDMAKEQFEAALEELENKKGDMAKSLTYEIGQIEEKLGNKQEALALYKNIFAVDAGYKDVAKKIQTLG